MANKLLKKLGVLFCLVALTGGIAALSACGDTNVTVNNNKDKEESNSGDNPGSNSGSNSSDNTGSENNGNDASSGTSSDATYKFEAEYTYMADVQGGGISGAAAGVNMITESANASNGFFVGSLHSTKSKLTFKINATAACTATLRVVLGNEIGAMTMSPNTFEIKVNDVEVNYTAFNLPGKGNTTTFDTYKIGDISLKQGENVITFAIVNKNNANEYLNGSAGGPLFDCITLKTSGATLEMHNYEENLD
jgi:hypothetical protein